MDALVKDALAALGVLDGQQLPLPAIEAAGLLALVAGQDVEQGEDGVFRIARKTAKDRVISTVDPAGPPRPQVTPPALRRLQGAPVYRPGLRADRRGGRHPGQRPRPGGRRRAARRHADDENKPEVVGDSAYGDAATRADLESQGFTVTAKCPPARNAGGRFAKDRFTVDLGQATVTCPAGQTAVIVPAQGAAAGRRSGPGAPPARCGRPAPRRSAGAPSPSTPKKPSSSGPAPSSGTRPGSSITAPTGPSWNARSPTSPAGPGAAATPAPAAWPVSPPTLPPAPEPSTGPGSLSSGSTTNQPGGHSGPREHPDGEKTTPGTAPRPTS